MTRAHGRLRSIVRYFRTRSSAYWLRAACVFVAAAALGFLAWHSLQKPLVAYNPHDPAFNRVFWKQEIDRLGPRAAYQEFLRIDAAGPQDGTEHLSAHVFGSLLADKYGPSGIQYCGPENYFGCYHGFLSEAIAAGGLQLIPQLDQACIKAFGPEGTGCQHGIGHGILEYLGYGKLDQALALCGETTHYVPLLGCESGVFMEYDFPLSGSAKYGNPKIRPYDPAHPYAPCDQVADQYLNQCYLSIGQYLRGVFLIKEGVNERDSAKLCEQLPEREQSYCFLGFGVAEADIVNFDMPAALAYCGQWNAQEELWCRAGVWWNFREDPPHASEADQACAYADTKQSQACHAFADLSEGKPLVN